MQQTLIFALTVTGFIFTQVFGAWKILSNIKEANHNNQTGLEVVRVHIQALEEVIKKQNSRLSKLEDRHENLNNSVIAHHNTFHPCK